jgi:hypothetical protein
MLFSTHAHFSVSSSHIFFFKSVTGTNIYNNGCTEISQISPPPIGTPLHNLGSLMDSIEERTEILVFDCMQVGGDRKLVDNVPEFAACAESRRKFF